MFGFVSTRCETESDQSTFCFWHLTKWSHKQASPWWHCGMWAFSPTCFDRRVLIRVCLLLSGSNHAAHSQLWATATATNPWRQVWIRDVAPAQKKHQRPSIQPLSLVYMRPVKTTQSCRFTVCTTGLAVNDLFSCLWRHMKTNNTSFLQTVKMEYHSCFSLREILVYLWYRYIYYVLIWAYSRSRKEPLLCCKQRFCLIKWWAIIWPQLSACVNMMERWLSDIYIMCDRVDYGPQICHQNLCFPQIQPLISHVVRARLGWKSWARSRSGRDPMWDPQTLGKQIAADTRASAVTS